MRRNSARERHLAVGTESGSRGQMVSEDSIAKLTERIVREFNPERIVLFGSYGRGESRPDSDVDVLVILPFEGTGFSKSVEILNRVAPEFPIDLLARRPADTARRYAEGDPFIREALDHGKILYERHR